MMSVSDIVQLIVLCAVIFFPLGFLARHYARPIAATLRLIFLKPRYVKPDGTLRRASVKADHRHD